MVSYIDVHAHLDSERFDDDLDEVIENAKKNDVLIVQSGVNPKTNKKSLELSKKYDIFCSFGLYPIDSIAGDFDGLKDDYVRDIEGFDFDSELKWIKENKDNCVAIGEIGLDFKVIECDENIKEAQVKCFEKAIDLASEIDKPIIIHSRSAELEAIEILEKKKCKKVVMHCFGGRKSLIKRGADNGWFFSVPPIIKRLQHFQTLVGLVPIEQLLTETDSPFLSPNVGERNEPVNVKVSVSEIARIKGIKEKETAEIILSNARKLFGF